MKYIVYGIYHDNKCRYVGLTNNLKRRTYQHNYLLNKGKDKMIYNYLREEGVDMIVLKPLWEYKTKVEAKRKEMFLILADHFVGKYLKQKIPNISDR